jgi:(2Fe-2S) ferredoxin
MCAVLHLAHFTATTVSVSLFVVGIQSAEGRCGAKGGCELLEAFRAEVERRGLPAATVLRNACARRHHEGPVVFVYPDDVWYTRVTPEDVPDIVERHLAPARVS